MSTATFHFHGGLDFFLPQNRGVSIPVSFAIHETVKHLLKSLGVPHTEVDVILVNGESVGFDRRPQAADRVDIYPPKGFPDLPDLLHLQPVPLDPPRFILDGHLGKLAIYLRILGLDSLYRNDFDDQELATISSRTDRILLTRLRPNLLARLTL